MGSPAVKLGLVGAIPENRAAVLKSLTRQVRLQLTDVHDPCLTTSEDLARKLQASSCASLTGLLCRCQGVVIADVRWMGIAPMLAASERQRPALILAPVLSRLNREELVELQTAAQSTGTLMMPELAARWARSTLRLRELTATQAGAIEEMELTCRGAPGEFSELLVFDWCVNVVQSECRSVTMDSTTGTMTLKFRRLTREGHPVKAVIHFGWTNANADFSIGEAHITCRHGRIRIAGEETLEWKIERRKTQESLISDRKASDVMCDLFGRRLVGGLVPIPEITDLIKAHDIRRAGEVSRERQSEVSLSG